MPQRSAALRTAVALSAILLTLAACSVPSEPVEIHDPYENRNRKVHEFNKDVDRAILRPVAYAYGDVPKPVRDGVSNFAGNLDMPRYVFNDLLQGEVEDAVHNTFRFLVNTTFGLVGFLDPAGDMGLDARDSDFGETLHVWGVREGAYTELPLLGPSTERDAVGRIADFIINPLSYVRTDTGQWVNPTASAIQVIDNRYDFGAAIDSVLYESADSYAQSRSLYLQNRRFRLGGDEPEYFDPYEDPYDQ